MYKKSCLLLLSFLLLAFMPLLYAYEDEYYDDYGGEDYWQPHEHYQSDRYYSGDDQDGYYPRHKRYRHREYQEDTGYSSAHRRLPQHISSHGEKVIVIDPHVHAWGAYSPTGELLRSGLATAGKRWCPDIDRACRTAVGSFRIYSLGSFNCKSHKFPVERGGGAPMPYCMFFNGGQGLHGSYEVVDGNASHGCVRLHVDDAEWIRFNFANVGTKVIVKPY